MHHSVMGEIRKKHGTNVVIEMANQPSSRIAGKISAIKNENRNHREYQFIEPMTEDEDFQRGHVARTASPKPETML